VIRLVCSISSCWNRLVHGSSVVSCFLSAAQRPVPTRRGPFGLETLAFWGGRRITQCPNSEQYISGSTTGQNVQCKAAATNSIISFADLPPFSSSLAIGCHVSPISPMTWLRRLTSHNHILLLSRRPLLALKLKALKRLSHQPHCTHHQSPGLHSRHARTTRVTSRSSVLSNTAEQRYKSRAGRPRIS
jgi:hypothetical protein